MNQVQYRDQQLFTKNIELTLHFFYKNEIPFFLSRNKTAFSCKDAAKKRNRNFHTGIPLEDELKTFFGEVKLSHTVSKLILINVSGRDRIDFNKIRRALNTEEKISFVNTKLMDQFGIKFGTVNPFLINEKYEIVKDDIKYDDLIIFFDKKLLSRKRSMMTNAGELNWGLEFKVSHIYKHFENSIIDWSIIE